MGSISNKGVTRVKKKINKIKTNDQNMSLINMKKTLAKKNKKIIASTIIFAFIIVGAIFAGIYFGAIAREYRYKNLVKAISVNDKVAANNSFRFEDLLGYKDSALIYEKIFMGNSNSNIITNEGKICFHNDVLYQSINGCLESIKELNTNVIYEKDVSYINVWKNSIIFRNNEDQTLYKFNPLSGKITQLTTCRVGETIVAHDTIFFKKPADSKVYFFDSKFSENNVTSEGVLKFAILGKYILYLNQDSVLKKKSLTKGNIFYSLDHISNFVCSDRIYACSGENIFSFSPDFECAKLICKGKGSLLAVGNNGIYTIKDSKLLLINEDTEKILAEDVPICNGIFEISKNEIILSKTSLDGETTIKKELVSCKF